MRHPYVFGAVMSLMTAGFFFLHSGRNSPDRDSTGQHQQTVQTKQSEPTPHLCSQHCIGHRGSRTPKAEKSLDLLWKTPTAESMTITHGMKEMRKSSGGGRQEMVLSDSTTLEVDVRSRHVHGDGTVAINGIVRGQIPGKLHMQWNEKDHFFIGHIEYHGHPVAYEINREKNGDYLISRRSIDQLVCSEVHPESGVVSYGLPALPEHVSSMESEGVGADGSGSEAPGLVPALNSYPAAVAVVYLDFDGQQVNGTSWGSSITAAPTGYSASKITNIWQRVAADMEPFQLNVTTEESVYLNAPSAKRIRCIITPSNEWYGSNTAGGVAKLGSFTWSGDTPCWVFSDNLANGSKYIAEACSHETGHTFGLSHDGKSGTTYYAGHGSGAVGWAPIMGNSYFKSLTQWSKGEYTNATNTQDDLSIITSAANGFGYRNDDHIDQNYGASPLTLDTEGVVADSGNIERQGDVDVFAFESGGGSLALEITPSSSFGNLDIIAELYDVSGNLIANANPSTQLNAIINTTVTSGSYFLHVRSTGFGTANTGSTNYASLGAYQITGQIPVSAPPTPYEISVASLPENQRGTGDDPDADGYANLTEHALGTDPAIANDHHTFTSMESIGSGLVDFLIDLPADIPADVIYTVEATCTMAAGDWSGITTRSTAGIWSGSAQVTEQSGPNGSRRFRISETSGGPWTCRFFRVSLALESP